jgi:hypothetical protein
MHPLIRSTTLTMENRLSNQSRFGILHFFTVFTTIIRATVDQPMRIMTLHPAQALAELYPSKGYKDRQKKRMCEAP